MLLQLTEGLFILQDVAPLGTAAAPDPQAAPGSAASPAPAAGAPVPPPAAQPAAVHASPPPGMTRAQQRQQEAWGSLAAVGLEEVLRRRMPPPQLQVPEANADQGEAVLGSEQRLRRLLSTRCAALPLTAGDAPCALPAAENTTRDMNSSNPSSKASSPHAAPLPASPKQAEQLPSPGASAGKTASGPQGRRKSLPPPSFVESLERKAALHR